MRIMQNGYSKNTIVGFFVFVVLFFGIYLLAGTKVDSPKKAIPKPTAVTKVNQEDVQYFRSIYVNGCVENGAKKAYCECTYDYILKKYGAQRLLELSSEISKSKETPKELYDATAFCMDKF